METADRAKGSLEIDTGTPTLNKIISGNWGRRESSQRKALRGKAF